jgi:hypothetical protein
MGSNPSAHEDAEGEGHTSGMVGQCRLCLEERPLRRSHILPELLHRQISDEKFRAVEVSVSRGTTRIRQTSEWQHLLCGACEALLQEHETYFSRVWFEFPKLPERPPQSVQVSGLDYRSFKLFHLSILWRAAVSERLAFEPVELGPHAEKLRKLLLSGDPGPAERYSLSGTILLDDDGAIHHKVLTPYFQSRVEGHHFYLGIYGGCEWTITVSSHYHRDLAAAHLTTDGRLLLVSQPLVDLSYFTEQFAAFLKNEAGRKHREPA